MKSYLKTEKVKVKALGETVTIKQLSGADLEAFLQSQGESGEGLGRGLRPAAMACVRAVEEWAGESVEDVMNNVPATAIQEICERVLGLQDETPKD